MNLYDIYRSNNIKGLQILFKKGHDKKFNGFIPACIGGNYELIKLFIDTVDKEELNYAFYVACLFNHKKLIELLISAGADNINGGFQGACEGGHKDLIKVLINKGANAWNLGLIAACKGGHQELVDFLISKGADNWTWAFESACEGGHRLIIDLIKSKGTYNCFFGFFGACRGGHMNIAKEILIKLEEDNYLFSNHFWNIGLRETCLYGHLNIVKFLISKGADDFLNSIEAACHNGNKKVIIELLKRGIIYHPLILCKSNYLCKSGYLYLLPLFKDKILSSPIFNALLEQYLKLILPVNYDCEILINKK